MFPSLNLFTMYTCIHSFWLAICIFTIVSRSILFTILHFLQMSDPTTLTNCPYIRMYHPRMHLLLRRQGCYFSILMIFVDKEPGKDKYPILRGGILALTY